TALGVGIDTSRYGHYAAFLDANLQAAAPELQVVESAAGYPQLRQRLADLVAKHGSAHFHVRLDAAGLYADNLLAFLASLRTDTPQSPPPPGAPTRNDNPPAPSSGRQKSAPPGPRACARSALPDRPGPTPPLSVELRRLRQVAGRLQAVVRQRTRLVNQLH